LTLPISHCVFERPYFSLSWLWSADWQLRKFSWLAIEDQLIGLWWSQLISSWGSSGDWQLRKRPCCRALERPLCSAHISSDWKSVYSYLIRARGFTRHHLPCLGCWLVSCQVVLSFLTWQQWARHRCVLHHLLQS
jgi:hypothetical protein